MKRIALALALALALSPAAFAQLYKYTDKDGKTVYTDQPPANVESKPMRVQTAPPTAAPTAAPKTALDKDKELDKGRKDAVATAKKGDEVAKREADNAQRCADARGNYELYESGGRVAKRNAQGERVFLEQSEIDAEKQKARAVMDEACKKS